MPGHVYQGTTLSLRFGEFRFFSLDRYLVDTINLNRLLGFFLVQEGCYEAVLPSERGEHIKSHDVPYGQYNSLDALFRRKRGRPPKNRVIEVWNDYAGGSTGDSPQAIFTSFKLPKPSQTGTLSEEAEVPTQTTLVRI